MALGEEDLKTSSSQRDSFAAIPDTAPDWLQTRGKV